MSEEAESKTHNQNGPPKFVTGQEDRHSLNLSDTLQLGSNLEYLRLLGDGENIKSPDKDHVLEVISTIHQILSSRDIETIVEEQIESYRGNLESSGEPKLSPSELENLEKKAITWSHLLDRELKNEKRIPAAEAGLLDIDGLIETPEKLFPGQVWDWLDDRPQSDLKEACKTLAVDCPTASVMLSLRAVEHCLTEWYEEENEELERAAWGSVLDLLMEEYAEEEKKNDTVLTQLSDLPPVLTTLYHLKEKRNEVSHPEKSPNPMEARRTLMIVASTISEIFEEVQGITPTDDRKDRIVRRANAEVSWNLSDRGDIVMSAIKRFDEENDYDGAPRDLVVDACRDFGLSEEEIHELIRDLLMGGHVYEPDENTLKPI